MSIRKKSRLKNIVQIVFFLSIFYVFLGNVSYASAEDNNTICKGVTIDTIDVSGMTREEAESAIDNLLEELKAKKVSILVSGKAITATLGELGYTYAENDYIEQALNIGTTGNLIKRYKDLKDIEEGGITFDLNFSFDDKSVRKLIKEKVSEYNIKPENASVKRVNGKFIYTDHKLGKKVDVNQTYDLIKNEILNWNRADIMISAVIVDDMPKYTKEVLQKCNTMLGTFTTEYASSAEGRAANLANGARLINNAVIYPGEVFSSYEYLTPFTVQNGYYQAGAYQNGKVIDSIGGGACQVTTTLYNAVLFSELEVVERASHSMTISYVGLSRDAAIAGTYKDFKFMNNTEVPILIEAKTVGRRITFNIWGHETRDKENRKIKFETVVLSETAPPRDVITKDSNQPTTYKRVTQSAHVGYKTELYKVVYENNVEVSRTLVNKSIYAAAPRYITVGTKVVKKPTPAPKQSEDKKPENLKPEIEQNTTTLDEPLDMAPTED